jgi:hypothetical protein
VSKTGTAISFDASNETFVGHSQGSLNGSLYLATDGSARGGVLSGSGSVILIALLEKTSPTPSVAQAVKTLLGAANAPNELNVYHPALNFAQTVVDPTDPVHYAGYFFLHPRKGNAPKSIYQTEGINPDGSGDTFAPPHGIELGSIAAGLPRQLPGIRPRVEAAYSGLGDVAVPAAGLSGNLANGQASGIFAQFAVPAGDDGHFVAFHVPQALVQLTGFVKALTMNPVGNVPPLQ